MNTFTKKLIADNEVVEFNFMRLYTGVEVVFFITVVDHSLVFHYFRMEVEQEAWRIIDVHEVPEWIQNCEIDLCQAIIESDLSSI